ncbi:MAG: CBS domain-containing protein [Gammaproteobacteria bacterium]|nr:CBS domain-containing protein [Gammaproteobacteria bacterium]
MNTTVGKLMSSPAITVDLDSSVAEVEEFLASKNLSFVPLTDDNDKCFGVLSKMDLVSFHAKHLDENHTQAWEVCTHDILKVMPSQSIDEALQIMLDHNISHLLVMENEKILGVVAKSEILMKLSERRQY